MNSLTASISAIANHLAVAVASGTIAATGATESTATSTAEPATAKSSAATARPAKTRSTTAAGSAWGAWTTAWLALDAQSPKSSGRALETCQGPAQSEITLAVL
jgi:hypothetical protein